MLLLRLLLWCSVRLWHVAQPHWFVRSVPANYMTQSGQVAGSVASIAQLMADNDGRSVTRPPPPRTFGPKFAPQQADTARPPPRAPQPGRRGWCRRRQGQSCRRCSVRATAGRSTGRRITQEAAQQQQPTRLGARLRDDNGFDVCSVIGGGGGRPAAKRPTRPTESARPPRADTTYTAARRQSATAAAATQPELVNKFGRTTANWRD